MSDSTKIAIDSMYFFLDDGTLNEKEVQHLLDVALQNGNVDEHEKRVLKSVFSKVTQNEVSPKTWELMERIRKQYLS